MHPHRSQKSRPVYLPRFPRVQRLLRRRLDDELLDYEDSEMNVISLPPRHH